MQQIYFPSANNDSPIDPSIATQIGSNSCQNETSITLIEEIEEKVNFIVPLLVVLGIIGNSLSVITFSQRKLRSLSCACYLLILAIVDTLALINNSRPYFLKKFNQAHHLESSFLCGFHLFSTRVFDELSPWLLVFVACNRLVLTKFPRNHRCFQTSKSAVLSTLLLILFFILLNIHLLFGIGLGYSTVSPCDRVCGPLSSSEHYLFFYQHISPIIDLIFSLIFPFCFIFIANIFIMLNVRKIRRRVICQRKHKRESRNSRLSIVLLADLITFLIVSAPVLVVEIVYRFTRSSTTIVLDEKYEQMLSISWLIANRIYYLNYSLSFYFYVLTSSYFRHQFYVAIRLKYVQNIFRYLCFKKQMKTKLTRKEVQSDYFGYNEPYSSPSDDTNTKIMLKETIKTITPMTNLL
ncbi:unnamed protein product [Didymodactylos carnosus]|uniref:G-protein coupled receptors family 1 profile domain-containing protein n=1 Tax=Didymodactylos carnosus TaxID=1234261 RepID=A0A813WHY9_9BILA|nr:unnamed protein product [Didymodactylos carnosus]CAF3638638.1 unnamed protein product [Didymodactylos carnosus]